MSARLDDSAFSLTEARILYELAHRDDATAADIGRLLGLDRGQLSRTLKSFRQRGLIGQRASPTHAKHQLLALTAQGRAAFAELDAATRNSVGALLGDLPPERRQRLLQAASAITDIFESEGTDATSRVVLRDLLVGDVGWITHRQAILYAEEYGWDISYEGLVAEILAGFVKSRDAARERAWIAEVDGAIAGSIFLMRSSQPDIARLRLLYVEPSARGLCIGRKLVGACIQQARDAGYRTLELWTNSVLVSARRIYEAAGFQLQAEEAHHSFGKDLVGQTWALDLHRES
ncbi:MAG TPA: helix-turn-helix domain-containing GNAT family N-acetyltransferase [Sphingomonas sp.]|nr:helix-turn-helix domain-containing GNAT family N-acetyltransferase [Sphingomonas sp.]